MAEASRTFHATLFSLPTFSPRFHFKLSYSHSHPSLHLKRARSVQRSISETKTMSLNTTLPWGCDIDSLENAEALQNWLSDSGLPPQKVGINKVEMGKRGLVALKKINRGEKILFVPPSLLITSDSDWSSPVAGHVLKQQNVADLPLLATYLISEANLQKSSRWSNYISSLPREPYSLLHWRRSELDRFDDLRRRIFSKHPHLFPKEVYLYSMDGKVALVPWADMLNHSCEVETYLNYDKSSQAVVFTTDRAYQPGEQVFISYGKKSNAELLLSYGFVPKQGTNLNDSVELPLSLKISDKCYKQKLKALMKHGLSASSQCYPIQISGWPLELMAYAYLTVSPPSMSKQFEEMAAMASNESIIRKDLRYPEIEEKALQFILDSCESSISKYSKFLKESGSMDLDITSQEQQNRGVFLKQLAVDLCTSEQKILYRAQYKLKRRLRDMRSGELRA
ncbi:Ribulose-1,5 bisphosphate carboxylase/oxygenase large subunit N-methyltransferase, chloroplastic [Gossypium arboreum]|uniref:Ribulose-1,5 bisphosphate carboxylase/oxygenase large subunit N-methyltransferase, chloroplastic n=1 Tax=Gossypium arboreum TaxID=29729 RepID=A0A0B0N7F4_GOSAR|nr:Ribulose-1,5 bisphosphate carboxylase/oxygenase large subunit N-methyltransferase, chloroplastic [Gossypium arboreum]